MDKCVIEELIETPFLKRSAEEKVLIHKMNRPTPDMKNLVTDVKMSKSVVSRRFPITIYHKNQWITGCEHLNKLFCWSCLLFACEKDRTVWSLGGFGDLNHLSASISRHEKSLAHLNCMLSFKTFGRQRIDSILENQKKEALNKHNEVVSKNRQLLRRLTDAVCYLGMQDLPLRSHDECTESKNRGNYIELLNFISKYDETLYNHLHSNSIFKGTTDDIQNDLIAAINQVLLEHIKCEIKNSDFVAILLDESSDISSQSQLSTVIRLVDEMGQVQEHFLNFSDVSRDRSATAISTHVLNLATSYDFGKKLVVQGYDGVAVTSGCLNGTQAKVRETCPNALFIHCSVHSFNLMLSKSVEFIGACKLFFCNMNSISNYFSHSTNFTQTFLEHVKQKFPHIAATQWSSNSRIVNFVYNKIDILSFFEGILAEPDQWDEESILRASGFVHFLEKFDTHFLLLLFAKIFAFTDTLFNILQAKYMDIIYCQEQIQETKNGILNLNKDFKSIYDETVAVIGPPNKTRRLDGTSLHSHFEFMFHQIIDTIISQMEVRLKSFNKLFFVELLNKQKFESYAKVFPIDQFNSLKDGYAIFFDLPKLNNELICIYNNSTFKDLYVNEILGHILNNDLKGAFSETYKLCSLILTMPVSTANVERSFFAIKRIKSYLKNSMGEERLSSLALISIEKDLLKKLMQKEDFYNTVIENFCLKSRRMEFTYK